MDETWTPEQRRLHYEAATALRALAAALSYRDGVRISAQSLTVVIEDRIGVQAPDPQPPLAPVIPLVRGRAS